jgi:hypothetical protein
MSDELDEGFEKSSGEKNYGGGGLAKLPDGKYTFDVIAAEFKKSDKATVLTLKIATQHGDSVYEGKHDYWLVGKEGVDERSLNNVKADLKALGFDVDEWTRANLRPFGEELTKACRVLVGLKIDGAKKNNESKGKTYTNIYINGRAMTSEKTTLDGKPEKFNAALIQEAVDLAESNPF